MSWYSRQGRRILYQFITNIKASDPKMRLLVSVVSCLEAVEAVKGGADIVDVKNPAEGSLGAQPPRIISEVSKVLHARCELSATIGDLPNLPGTASLAALGAAVAGADYVKAGLFGVSTQRDAERLLTPIVEAVKGYDGREAIAAGYADHQTFGSLPPVLLPPTACKTGCYGILVDLKSKGPRNLFDHCGENELRSIIRDAHNLGLKVALAGGLGLREVDKIKALEADIIGVRRAVCNSRDWVNGRLDVNLVAILREAIQSA